MPRLAIIVLLALTAAGCAGAKTTQPQVLSVEIGDAIPFTDSEDAYNTLGNRYWSVAPDVVARLARPCSDVRLAVDVRALFNGLPDRGWYLGGGSQKAPGQRPAGFELRSPEEAYAPAGDTIELAARASCLYDGSVVAATATRRFDLPTASCAAGPVRAFEVDGVVTARPDGVGPALRLAPGDVVRPGSLVIVGSGGRVAVGAPECNGFSATLSPGTYWTGSYDASGRGDAFSGERIDAVGDSHAGGFATEGNVTATVEPLGDRCRDCPQPNPARYAVRSLGRRAVVRVEEGSVRVRGRTGSPVRVRAGEQTSVVCPTTESCTATTPRLFQPREPWGSPIATTERPFRRVLVTPNGKRPPARDLAPPRSSIETSVLPAGERVPEQVFVLWRRESRTVGGPAAGRLRSEQGVLVWEGRRQAETTEWRIAYSRRYPGYLTVRYQIGDVTRDGHADVLLEATMGTAGCGSFRLIATVARIPRELLLREDCEIGMWIGTRRERAESGDLVIREPVGPCPYRPESAHCSGGTREVEKRWNGRRLVTVGARVDCVLPRLDPRRECRPRSS